MSGGGGGILGGFGGGGGGGLMGGMLGPILGSQKPRQDERQYVQTDPFRNLKPQQQFTEDLLRGSVINRHFGGAGGVGDPSNPFVRAGPEQQQALAALQGFQQQATPAFGSGLRGIEETMAGKYLDPTQQAPFQALSSARQNLAQQMFADAQGKIASGGIAAGAGSPYSSSATRAQTMREGGRLSNLAAQDIAQAGFGQYGAERGFQDAAMRQALGLAPGLAGQVFAGGETLRAAEQGANTAQMQARIQAQEANMRGRLAEMGLDQNAIENVLKYMHIASGQPLGSVVGKSPYEQNLAAVESAGSLMGGLKGK